MLIVKLANNKEERNISLHTYTNLNIYKYLFQLWQTGKLRQQGVWAKSHTVVHSWSVYMQKF